MRKTLHRRETNERELLSTADTLAVADRRGVVRDCWGNMFAGHEHLYLPLLPAETGSSEREMQLVELADGRIALTAYTTLTLLIRHCGSAQHWGEINQAGLEAVLAASSVDVVLLNPDLPEVAVPEHSSRNYLVDPVR